MKRQELILTLILVLVLSAGSGYEFYRGGGKTAEVIYIQENTTPFDLEITPTPPVELTTPPQPAEQSQKDSNNNPAILPLVGGRGRDISSNPSNPQQIADAPRILQWLNQAARDDLQQISGIGAKTAENIITYRAQNGGFRTLNQLSEVSGIGDRRREDILRYIRQEIQPAMSGTFTSSKQASEENPLPNQKFSLNQATAAQLQSVQNIGPALAQTILEARAQYRNGFESWDQVRGISGVGKARVELLQQHFVLE